MARRATPSRLTIAALALALAAGATAQDPSPEELGTARALMEAHRALGDLRALPGGCPAAGDGVVRLADVFEAAGRPAPEGAIRDGWGHPLMAWCDARSRAVISSGADGLLAGTYDALPDVAETGDDFVLIDAQRFHAPARVLRMAEVGKQKRTMADVRSVAIVVESFRMDNDALPGAPTDGFVPVETLRELVQPVYIRELPVEDGWGNPIWVWSDGSSYRIVSAGADRILDRDWAITPGAGAIDGIGADIVFGDGEFRQWPREAGF